MRCAGSGSASGDASKSARRCAGDEPTTWQIVRPAIMKRVKAAENLFDPILGPTTSTALDELLGEGEWHRPDQPGQLLMTPPSGDEWVLPAKGWHMDVPAPPGIDRIGAQLFLLLDEHRPRGGATLAVAGSHRLVRWLPDRADSAFDGHSGELRQVLKRRVPWVRALEQAGPNEDRISRFCDAWSEHEGIPLRVVEMTGSPGDEYLMDLWTLHAGSANTGDRMRMMVAERVFTRGHRRVLWGA